jgi:hypothetical protein
LRDLVAGGPSAGLGSDRAGLRVRNIDIVAYASSSHVLPIPSWIGRVGTAASNSGTYKCTAGGRARRET